MGPSQLSVNEAIYIARRTQIAEYLALNSPDENYTLKVQYNAVAAVRILGEESNFFANY
jgi:hypothetical protein